MATVLKSGSSGALVSTLQELLNKAKLPKPVVKDGKFGPPTLEAVKLFQRKAGLVTDGIVGPKTAAAFVKIVGSSANSFAQAIGPVADPKTAADTKKPATEAAGKSAAEPKAAAAGDAAGTKELSEADRQKVGKLLIAGLQRAQGGAEMQWLCTVKDATTKVPIPGLLVAPKVGPQHKQVLTEVTGSKRFLMGTCLMESGKLTFVVTGASASASFVGLIRKSIQYFTGKSLSVRTRGKDDPTAFEETDEADAAGQESAAGKGSGTTKAAAKAPPQLGKPELATAAHHWKGMREVVDANVKALKSTILREYADANPQVVAAIDKGLGKLDVVLQKLDTRLADSLEKANTAANPAASKAELQNSKKILMEYIKYVKAEPLIAHIDSNPFGVDTKLGSIITDHLTHMAKSIGV